MANFYYGNDEGQSYWLNLDHVSFVKPDSDKLILKAIDGSVFRIDQEDYHALKQILWEKTLNWDEEFKDNDKRHNYEDVPTREKVEASNDIFKPEDFKPRDCHLDDDELFDEPSVDYGYDNSQSTDDHHLDIEPPTGIPFKPEDWKPKDCYLDDDEIPI